MSCGERAGQLRRQIRILQADDRRVTPVEILDRVDGAGVQPAGTAQTTSGSSTSLKATRWVDLPGGGTCATTGTVAGACTYGINSIVAGTYTATAEVTVIVDGVSITRSTDNDPANIAAGGTGNATKNYSHLRISITPTADTNAAGDPHTFTVNVEQSTANGVWVPVPNGTIEALTLAQSWVGTISPPGVLAYQEEESRGVWQTGNSVFMRNWPYAYGLGNGEDSPIVGWPIVVVLSICPAFGLLHLGLAPSLEKYGSEFSA